MHTNKQTNKFSRSLALQRSRWREAEESLEAVSAELERERAQHEAAQLTNAVYEHMVEYKEQMLGALNAAHEVGMWVVGLWVEEWKAVVRGCG